MVAAALMVAAVVPPPAATGQEDPAVDDLGSARDQLADAERSLTAVEEAVRHANDQVAMLDVRLQDASTELAQVAEQLVDAEAALDVARSDERIAAGRLAEADTALEHALDDWASNRDLLQQRAIHTFKHGRTSSQDLLVRGIANAGDWHEVAVTLETVGRIATDDQELVAGSVDLTRSTADLRAAATTARSEAVTTARAAAEEERRVAALLERHVRIVADIDHELRERSIVLASLEADAAARAVLVQDLERRVAELELSARRVLIPIVVDLDVHGPPPPWADRLPPAGRQYAAAFEAIGARHGVDGRLIAALVWAESNFRPDAVSHAGALGLAQLMPGTARGLGVDPRDPLQNIEGGTRYLRAQLDRFGSVELALAAYNAGPGRVERAGGIPNIVETQLYVVRVLDLYEQISR